MGQVKRLRRLVGTLHSAGEMVADLSLEPVEVAQMRAEIEEGMGGFLSTPEAECAK